ncbi:G protein-coupled receptor family protein [Fowlpox virus]|uniref:G-protein coupled receptor homolog FPV027 n=1 Tax=Fowlpox virus (strain NVSL) TaxID=928301 RepID=V027_FOWPN|nr:G protein-coupled receptor gene family protein [Fowlpox virus]Q9J5H4.1 RecName: Full=G-protein coupled receptor homolog FPV027 [Fowlpox virus strain NVSL]UNS14212.1 ALPV-048 [Albatrosspox virus]WPD90979.1 G protein-coupled receptor family protein [Avipoxvirus sp.]AAF44371.1 ORF FPV027 G protein-coupled receptor gene family protein [Fowlpox virus]AXY04468.1 G protein-coupled receptor family protein [Fowlpox virus]AXY04730.1 G protein-coupled receptor family protein [Fowlpox virus]
MSMNNITSKMNQDSYGYFQLHMSDFTRVSLSIVFTLVFLVGIIGNAVIIWFIGFKWTKTISTLLFINLALADSLFLIFIPVYTVYVLSNFHWYLGEFLCRVSSFFFTTNMYASMFLLTFISIDKYLTLTSHRLVYKYRKYRNYYVCIGAIWCISIALGVPTLYYKRVILSSSRNETRCISYYGDDKHTAITIYRIIVCIRFIIGYVFPMTVILLSYALIVYKVKFINKPPNRSFMITTASIFVFLACWTPHHVLNIISLYGLKSTSMYNYIKESIPFVNAIAFVYSAINPIIYIFVIRLTSTYDSDTMDELRSALLDEETTSTEDCSDIEISDISR